MNPYEFSGYQKCTTTTVIQRLLSTNIFCVGERIQFTYREKRPELDGAKIELSIVTPQKYVGSQEDQKYLSFKNRVSKSRCFLKISIPISFFRGRK